VKRLVAVALPAGTEFVDAMRRAWDEDDAVLPVDQRLPVGARTRLLDTLRPSVVIEPGAIHERADGEPVESGDALVMATSGTTGEPKGVVLTHAAIAASAIATSRRLGVDPDRDEWLACMPLAHIGGLSVICRALLTDTAFTVLPSFDPVTVEQAAESGATLVSMVPTMLARTDVSAFRQVVLGGSSLPPIRPANTVASYGMTETGSGMVYEHEPLDGVEIRVVNGEIQVRGPILLRSYRDGSDPKDPEGWYATGDGGSLDSGRLEVFGRIGDMIITGGENVWPAPVEEILSAHPGIAEVAVVGRPDPEWGERVTAVIVPAGDRDVSLEALRDLVRAELPAYCAPHAIEYATALTRTSLGKVRREAL
jgi:o-succinylbenzoate---CoA ligase